jgi:hypothetical protein
MPPPDLIGFCFYEDRVILAVQCFKSDASLSVRNVASMYNVSRTTLTRRRVGTRSQRDIYPSRSNFTKSEEDSLVRGIRDLPLRGFASMADQLLAARGGACVGINGVERFIKHQPDIKSQLTRPRTIAGSCAATLQSLSHGLSW